jgi:hypothetical protein
MFSLADIGFDAQLQLSRRVPLCYATLLGTHNSAITIADGYGNLDLYFQQYFQLISWVVCTLTPSSSLTAAQQWGLLAGVWKEEARRRPGKTQQETYVEREQATLLLHLDSCCWVLVGWTGLLGVERVNWIFWVAV